MVSVINIEFIVLGGWGGLARHILATYMVLGFRAKGGGVTLSGLGSALGHYKRIKSFEVGVWGALKSKGSGDYTFYGQHAAGYCLWEIPGVFQLDTRVPGALQTVVLLALQKVRRIDMYVYSMKCCVMQTFDSLGFRSWASQKLRARSLVLLVVLAGTWN